MGWDDKPTDRDRIKVMDEAWLWQHVPVYLCFFFVALGLYLAIIHTFHGDSAVSDTVGATGVLASVLTLLIVVFQIDVGLRIARSQTQIADRELEILESQDADMRRLPDLSLRFAGNADDGSFLTCGMRAELANAHLPTEVRFAIVNTGKGTTSVVVDLFLPFGIILYENPSAPTGTLWTNRQTKVDQSGMIEQMLRLDAQTLRIPERFPIELPTVPFNLAYHKVPSNIRSGEFPPPYVIRYRLTSEGISWPSEDGYGELRLLPLAFLSEDSKDSK